MMPPPTLPNAAARLAAGGMLGRFELRRELGLGAQASVWLAHDPQLQREVAVKLMSDESDASDTWLQEARSVSRLSHPHIVPVFEAGRHGAQAYLVFEYVAGPTLAQHLRAHGAMSAHEAVAMMLGVLDALQLAHAAGVVHRDLKPSNILIDASGRARVMDFGIAARLNERSGSGDVVGTPGYMSPEAAAGAPPEVVMDVFSAGLVLCEMLAGRRLIPSRDAAAALQHTLEKDLRLPDDLPAAVDDPLRAVLLRAVARDPSRRWPSAEALRDALQVWLAPGPAADAAESTAAGAGSGGGTLEFLLRRMRHKTDFPAMSDSVLRIRRITGSENDSVSALSNEILKDVALTNKLLRLVNAAHFPRAEGGAIGTVSRAVALVGFNTVRNLAMSLVLLEHMHDKDQAGQLVEEFLRSLMAGTLAAEFGRRLRDSEEAFVAAMFHNLGRLLAEYYLPEEARRVRGLLAAPVPDGNAGLSEETAAVRVLGLSFEDLALGVARTWGLPETQKRCMRKSPAHPPAGPCSDAGEQLRWVVMAANDITDALLRHDPVAAQAKVARIAADYSRVLGLSAERIQAAITVARQEVNQLAAAMKVPVKAGSAARRMLNAPPAGTAQARAAGTPATPGLPVEADAATLDQARTVRLRPPGEASALLSKGIQNITNSMAENARLNELLQMVLEAVLGGLGVRRVVFCLRDPKTDTLTGRFGLGDGATAAATFLKVPLREPQDLFTAVCLKGADTLVSDATAPNFVHRLPAWYTRSVNAPAFLLLPMSINGRPFALIYADHAQPGGIDIGEQELGLVRTLRNQAVLAFKQQG